VKLASSGYFKAVGVLRLFHTQADIGVQFAQKTVAQVTGSNEFSFSSCKRAVIDDELHGDRRFGNLLEWNGFRILRRAEGVSDRNIGNTGNRYNRTDRGFFYFYFVQTVKFIQFADLDFLLLVRIVMV